MEAQGPSQQRRCLQGCPAPGWATPPAPRLSEPPLCMATLNCPWVPFASPLFCPLLLRALKWGEGGTF